MFEPTTEAINNKIAAIAREKHQIVNPWIGIRHLHDENRTVFVSDNTEVAWSYWDANEPNNENAGEDCAHLYTPSKYNPTVELKDCNFMFKHIYTANGYCNDESNTEECAWDTGDCCGDIVNMVDNDGNPTCSSCQCLEPSRWNDNTCGEFRRFICEKEGTG